MNDYQDICVIRTADTSFTMAPICFRFILSAIVWPLTTAFTSIPLFSYHASLVLMFGHAVLLKEMPSNSYRLSFRMFAFYAAEFQSLWLPAQIICLKQ